MMGKFKCGQRVQLSTVVYLNGGQMGAVLSSTYNEHYVGEEEIARVKLDRSGKIISVLATYLEVVS